MEHGMKCTNPECSTDHIVDDLVECPDCGKNKVMVAEFGPKRTPQNRPKLYRVGEFSSHWHDGEQPTKTTKISGMDQLVELIREHDLLHESDREMYNGVELRIVRILN